MSLLLFLSLFTTAETYDFTTPSVPEKLVLLSEKLCSKLDTQLQKKEEELQEQLTLIQKEELFQQLTTLQKKDDLHPQQVNPVQKTLTLLEAILEKNNNLLQCPLLKSINEQIRFLEEQELISFVIPGLKKERVILADIKEEYDFIKTINMITKTNIEHIKTTLIPTIDQPQKNNQPDLSLLYKNYFDLGPVKKAIALFEKIEALEAQKIVSHFKDATFVHLINSPEAQEFRISEQLKNEQAYQRKRTLKRDYFLTLS